MKRIFCVTLYFLILAFIFATQLLTANCCYNKNHLNPNKPTMISSHSDTSVVFTTHKDIEKIKVIPFSQVFPIIIFIIITIGIAAIQAFYTISNPPPW